MHKKSSNRFSFIVRNKDIQFNFNILVNILYIEIKLEDDNKSILHTVNEATRFQAERWLKDISAKHVWNQLWVCWINTYLRSSKVITSDANKQFVTKKFKQYVANISIEIKTISVETHHSIEIMKRYHESLRLIYSIIVTEMSTIDLESALQISFKTWMTRSNSTIWFQLC